MSIRNKILSFLWITGAIIGSLVIWGFIFSACYTCYSLLP